MSCIKCPNEPAGMTFSKLLKCGSPTKAAKVACSALKATAIDLAPYRYIWRVFGIVVRGFGCENSIGLRKNL